jgi:hypothetical protein
VEVLVDNCRSRFNARSSGEVLHEPGTYNSDEDSLHLKHPAMRRANHSNETGCYLQIVRYVWSRES